MIRLRLYGGFHSHGGTPKSSILIGLSMFLIIHFGIPPIYGNLHKIGSNHCQEMSFHGILWDPITRKTDVNLKLVHHSQSNLVNGRDCGFQCLKCRASRIRQSVGRLKMP